MRREHRDKLAHLKIQTWIGRSPGASHYHGMIYFKGMDIAVNRKLTFDQALDLNNRELLVYNRIALKRDPGEISEEFLTEKEAIDRAKKIFHKKVKQLGAVALVKGERNVIEAKPIIAISNPDNKTLMRKANKLYKKIEAFYNVDEVDEEIDYKSIDALEDEWWEIIGEMNEVH